MQLLAAVVLNELADIDQKDVLQQQLITNLNSGSLGMGQINVHTALKHGLLRGFLATPSASTAAQLLAVPQYSIEAAAREIRHLLDLMEHDPKAPWPARFKFAPPPPGDRDPMRYYRKGVITVPDKDTEEDREALFARMVASAYNGGDAFLGVAAPNKSQPNSWIHGANAESIARDLYQFQLYRSPCSPAQAAEKGVEKHKVAPGESLSKIAQTYYKDMHLWPLIYDENKKLIGSDPNKLKAGVELVIPDLSEIDPIRIREAKRRAALGPSATPVPVTPAR